MSNAMNNPSALDAVSRGLSGVAGTLQQMHGVQLERMQRLQQSQAELTARQQLANLDREMQQQFRQSLSDNFQTGNRISEGVSLLDEETRSQFLVDRLAEVRENALSAITTPGGRAAFESRMDTLENMYQESMLEKETNLIRAWNNSQVPVQIDQYAVEYAADPDPIQRRMGMAHVQTLLQDSVTSGDLTAQEAAREWERVGHVFANHAFNEFNSNPVDENGMPFTTGQWEESYEATIGKINQFVQDEWIDEGEAREYRSTAAEARITRMEGYSSQLSQEQAHRIVVNSDYFNVTYPTQEQAYAAIMEQQQQDESYQKLDPHLQAAIGNSVNQTLGRIFLGEGNRGRAATQAVDMEIERIKTMAERNVEGAIQVLGEYLDLDNDIWTNPDMAAARTRILNGETVNSSSIMQELRTLGSAPFYGYTVPPDTTAALDHFFTRHEIAADGTIATVIKKSIAEQARESAHGSGTARDVISPEHVFRAIESWERGLLRDQMSAEATRRQMRSISSGTDNLAREGFQSEETLRALIPILGGGSTSTPRHVTTAIMQSVIGSGMSFATLTRDADALRQNIGTALQTENPAIIEPLAALFSGVMEFAAATVMSIEGDQRSASIEAVLEGPRNEIVLQIVASNRSGPTAAQATPVTGYYQPVDHNGELRIQEYRMGRDGRLTQIGVPQSIVFATSEDANNASDGRTIIETLTEGAGRVMEGVGNALGLGLTPEEAMNRVMTDGNRRNTGVGR